MVKLFVIVNEVMLEENVKNVKVVLLEIHYFQEVVADMKNHKLIVIQEGQCVSIVSGLKLNLSAKFHCHTNLLIKLFAFFPFLNHQLMVAANAKNM